MGMCKLVRILVLHDILIMYGQDWITNKYRQNIIGIGKIKILISVHLY